MTYSYKFDLFSTVKEWFKWSEQYYKIQSLNRKRGDNEYL